MQSLENQSLNSSKLNLGLTPRHIGAANFVETFSSFTMLLYPRPQSVFQPLRRLFPIRLISHLLFGAMATETAKTAPARAFGQLFFQHKTKRFAASSLRVLAWLMGFAFWLVVLVWSSKTLIFNTIR